MADNITETASIRKLVEASQNVPYILKDSKGRDILLRPTGSGAYAADILTSPDEVERKPLYAQGAVALQTTTSMITYLNRFKTSDTMLFADVDCDTIVAAIDYHKASDAGSAPGLRMHRAKLVLPTSIEWDTWEANDCPEGTKNLMDQKELTEFIQENHRDFISPLGLDLLEAVLNVEKTVTMHVGRKMRRAGSDQGTIDNNVQVDGTELPPEWTLNIPVYRGESPVQITAYAREKMVDGDNLLGYKLAVPDRVKEDAFFAIASNIAAKTGVPIVLGTMNS